MNNWLPTFFVDLVFFSPGTRKLVGMEKRESVMSKSSGSSPGENSFRTLLCSSFPQFAHERMTLPLGTNFILH